MHVNKYDNMIDIKRLAFNLLHPLEFTIQISWGLQSSTYNIPHIQTFELFWFIGFRKTFSVRSGLLWCDESEKMAWLDCSDLMFGVCIYFSSTKLVALLVKINSSIECLKPFMAGWPNIVCLWDKQRYLTCQYFCEVILFGH